MVGDRRGEYQGLLIDMSYSPSHCQSASRAAMVQAPIAREVAGRLTAGKKHGFPW
jgi:hypothetical protein